MASSRAPGRLPWLVGGTAAVAFLVLTLLVVSGSTQPLDTWVRDRLPPHGGWTPLQQRVDLVAEGLGPRPMGALLVLVGAVASLRRRTWRPFLLAASLAVSVALLTLTVKVLVHRPDPGGAINAPGGSYPSGHEAALLACAGGVLLVLLPRLRWWTWSVLAVLGLAMGGTLLVQSAHWLTDVLGGALLAMVLVSAVSTSPVRRPESPQRYPTLGSPT